jgi:hypothetical protein
MRAGLLRDFSKQIDEIYAENGVRDGTRSTLSKETGYTERKISELRTLADLIPALSQLLVDDVITQRVAYQLAQLPALTM